MYLQKSVRLNYQNTLQTKSPGPPGATLTFYQGHHYLVDMSVSAVWPSAGYLTSLGLSALCKMGLTAIPTSQGCCEDQIRQCTERAKQRAWHSLSPELAAALGII